MLNKLTHFITKQSKQVKSLIDFEALEKWHEYTIAQGDMFKFTDQKSTPWISINSNDKHGARAHAIRYLLSQFDYSNKNHQLVSKIDNKIVIFKGYK